MSKFTKLMFRPRSFFQDAAAKRRISSVHATTYVIGFSTWKQYLRKFFPDRNLVFIPKDIAEAEFFALYARRIKSTPGAEIFIWGYKAPDYILNFAQISQVKVAYVEDGFLRSKALGATKAPPFSLCIDWRTPYFDARRESDLEYQLKTFDFANSPDLLARAEKVMANMLSRGVSKYNSAERQDVSAIYGIKSRTRVLVLGQVEDDASIKYGCDRPINGSELVKLAASENPGAQIIYKPHPDVLHGFRENASSLAEVESICLVLKKDLPLAQAFEGVDRVYTVTSLAGFEALMRGIKVTLLGAPFYAGWGLTDDRQESPRRGRILTATQVFAIAYIKYAQYFDVETGRALEIEDVIQRLASDPPVANGSPKPSMESALQLSTNVPAASVVEGEQSNQVVRTEKRGAGTVPSWFRSIPTPDLTAALQKDMPAFLYFPWIAEHTDLLISRIRSDKDYLMVPLDLIKDIEDEGVRRDVNRFVREQPQLYRRMVARRLVPLRGRISGVVFTFDWSTAARILSTVCEELEIPRILIPHESVFVNRDKYYWDSGSMASKPAADVVLGWGGLQKDIFIERGYPEDRFVAVGAPKFDSYFNYQPQLHRTQYCRLFGLDPTKKIILFASQPMDSQLDATVARESQRKAIFDLLAYCDGHGTQLLVRLPPSKDDVIGAALRAELSRSTLSAVDEATCYLVRPEEALFHCDAVVSINSTMLFEGVLMGRPALSMKYVEFEQLWENVGIPAVGDSTRLPAVLDSLLNNGWQPSSEGWGWAEEMLSNGKFDGNASLRIRRFLKSVAQNEIGIQLRPAALDRVLDHALEGVDVIGIPSDSETLAGPQKYLLPLLKARTAVNTKRGMKDVGKLSAAEIFVQWGIFPTAGKSAQADIQRALGRPLVIVEDGFIRSVDIGLSGEPGLSIIIDDTTAYYDATRPSRLERLLQSEGSLTAEEHSRAKGAIRKVVQSRVSKYNHAPDIPLTIGTAGKPKILMIDQRYGDQSVTSGLADERTFEKMLADVIKTRPGHDIIIKQHPDAIKGGKSSYFSNDRIAYTKFIPHVHLVNFDVNPYSLLDIVDEVHVVTSGLGFEALMAGKKVYCYGAPFYAGWGATIDALEMVGRTKPRTTDEIFHYAYLVCSRYYHPEQGKVVEIEDLIDYIVSARLG